MVPSQNNIKRLLISAKDSNNTLGQCLAILYYKHRNYYILPQQFNFLISYETTTTMIIKHYYWISLLTLIGPNNKIPILNKLTFEYEITDRQIIINYHLLEN